MPDWLETFLIQVIVIVPPILIAVTFHEAAHGFVASKLGDDTARRAGRVTFNPLKHIDPFGTIILPAGLWLLSGGSAIFGYAKPVPVNFGALNNPRRDMVLVALAGPMTNLGLAVVSAMLFHVGELLPESARSLTWYILGHSVFFNLVLMVFNLFPIPPLDGGRVAVGLLPRELAWRWARMERFGILLILAMLFLAPLLGRQLGMDLNVFYWLVFMPADWLAEMIGMAVGIR